ncbi:MAG: hypothetical protein BWK73_44025 [Thiothrix lacustris]|uniref:Uncharacterized protein n=1 Tax=Thiothrix lacustris TaxID=525917 RepID=A0A1Y1QBM9_9GAMM|nr:MAG: hypothetical protein BWK73_44025 [Thiothrix lacustris]
MKYHYELFADYFQFYLQDEQIGEDLSNSWTENAIARMLATAIGTIGIGTVRNTHVPVTIELLESEPFPDLADWDHVTECSIDLPSGNVVVAGCMDYLPTAACIEVAPGLYRARIAYGSLDTLSEDGLDGDDHYRIQLWRGESAESQVLKQWKLWQ